MKTIIQEDRMDSIQRKKRKLAGAVIDCLMYLFLVLQMLYVFVGNTVHEWLGIGFFLCLILHLVLKRKWLMGLLKAGERKRSAGVRLFEAATVSLLLAAIALMASAMDVSRVLFPKVLLLGSAALHRYLATAVLTLSVFHGGLALWRRSQKKKRMAALIALLMALSLALGLALVPYLDRHVKKVETSYEQAVVGSRLTWKGAKPLTVYFTRLGNTDFSPDVDAVSGASLLLVDGKLTGNCQFLAEMVQDALNGDTRAIVLAGEKYPSSYNETIAVAQRELRENSRPAIEPVDVSGYDEIILIYPLWWGSIPMPVATFLESADFTGKTIHLIASQGSRGFASSAQTIRALCPGATVKEGISIYCDDIPKVREQIGRYLETILQQAGTA